MKVFRHIEEIKTRRGSAVTVGTFDGFHLGHRAILNKLRELANSGFLDTTIVTFDPHPRKVLGGEGNHNLHILTATEEKLTVFREAGIDQVVIIPFTRAFASLSSEAFVKTILVEKLSVKQVVTGYDHHFGRNREGGFRELIVLGSLLGFEVHRVPPFEKDGEIVSSSLIRRLLRSGEVARAAGFIGRPYLLKGRVVKGDGRGKKIGFPTANLELDHDDKLLPAEGVYAVNVSLDQRRYNGMMNIGRRPTFDFDRLTLEVHIFNFSAEIYGSELTVEFKKFIRRERKFSDINELRSQLKEDKVVCENI